MSKGFRICSEAISDTVMVINRKDRELNMEFKRKRFVQRNNGPRKDYQMDMYYRSVDVGNGIDVMTNCIVKDLINASDRDSEMFDSQEALAEIEVLPAADVDMNFPVPGISIKQLPGNVENDSLAGLFHFHPFSAHKPELGNWNLFSQSTDTGFLAIDALIRLLLFPGLICIDIEDVFSVFHSGNAMAFELDHFTYEDVQSVVNNNLLLGRDLVHYLAVSPTNRYETLEQFMAFGEEVRFRYGIRGEKNLNYATYFAPSEKNRAVVFAG